MSDEEVREMFDFRRRVIRIATTAVLCVCGLFFALGFFSIALGFALGSTASILGFLFAVSKSQGLLAITSSRRAAVYAWKCFLPKYLLYAVVLFIGAKVEAFSFPAVAVGVFLCNVILILYEPVISKLSAKSGGPA